MGEFNYNSYLKHASGIYLFLSWLQAEIEIGNKYEAKENIISLSPLASHYFLFGKMKDEVFLAAQDTEATWLNLINWSHLNFKKNYLYLVSKFVKGDNDNLIDLAPMAVGIFINHQDKINILSKQKKIVGKEFLIDNDKSIRVNHVKTIFNLKVNNEEKIISELNDDEIVDYLDLIKNKLDRTNVYDQPNYQQGEVDNYVDENLAKNPLIKDLFLKK